MNARKVSRLVLAAGILAATSGLTHGGSSGRLAPPPSTFVYVFDNTGSPRVHAFGLADDGQFTTVSGSPFTAPDDQGDCSGFCGSIAWSAARGVLLTAGGSGISSWTVGADGTPTQTGGSPYVTKVSEPLTSVAAVTVGERTFAYASQYFGKTLDGFEVAADGTLTRLKGFPKKGLNRISVMSAAGDKLVACDEKHHKIFSFKVSATGSVKKLAPAKVAGKGKIYYAAIDPSAAFACTGDYDRGHSVYGFQVSSSGKLKKAAGKPLALDIANADGGIAFASPALLYAFESNGDGGADVQAVSVGAKGALSALGGAQTSGLSDVRACGVSPDGKFLVAVSNDSAQIRSYSVNAETGALTEVDALSVSFSDANGLTFVTR